MTVREPIVVLKNAGICQQNQWRVRHVDLSLSDGEIITLIGPNGSGKSSTVQMALGLTKPDEGSAVLRKNIRIGYVPQKMHIDKSLPITAERFMRLGGKLTTKEIQAALSTTGISDIGKQAVQELSGGQFQRVLLARAIAKSPNLLVLDEPMQGVDAQGLVELYQLIVDIRDQLSCAILLISHDLHVVMRATDRVICLNGHICCQGSPQEVMRDTAYIKLFQDSSASKVLSLYQHHHDHEHLPDGSVKHLDDPHAG